MRTRKLYVFMLAVAAVLTACTNEDNFINELLPNSGNEARTYTVNIPASMGEGATNRAVTFNNDATPPTATGRFDASEPVYVYNETKKALLSGVLHPSNIKAGGKLCNLEGTLTGSFDEGDQLTLLYNMNHFKADKADCYFGYDYQEGSESGVVDGGMATGVNATISGSTLTTATTVTFAMQQAIFRLKFTDGTNTISVNKLTIECTGSDVVGYYSPFNEDNKYEKQTINVMPTTPTSDYLYVALGINENASPSELTFTVIDDDGDVYTGTKAAPSSGFKNGKYYYSSAATVLTKQTLVKPTITWTSVDDDITDKEPASDNWYYVTGPKIGEMMWGPSEFTISGTSRGYRFYAYNGATIHLDNLDAIHDYYDIDFICSSNDQYQLILDINGTNSITTKNNNYSIYADGTLKLMGNGTLTVTANNSDLYGLYADMNYKSGNNSDASVLAAPGYAVTRSATTDNLDGTYTWTYTVMPVINGKFSVSDTKQVYFSKGNLQATTTDLGATWTWAFAANQWDYVGNAAANTAINDNGTVSANGIVDLFGWVGASSSWNSAAKWGISASKNSNDYGNIDDEALKSDWGNVPGIGSGWYTLSLAEWNYLFNTRSATTVNGVNDARYAKAIVNGENGIVLFPDSYTHPTGVTAPKSINSDNISFANAHNNWSGDDWTKMEKAGCVFLPAGGNRNGTIVTSGGLYGYYWTSTSSEGSAYNVYYSMSTVNTSTSTNYRYKGQSVRLVRDAN